MPAFESLEADEAMLEETDSGLEASQRASRPCRISKRSLQCIMVGTLGLAALSAVAVSQRSSVPKTALVASRVELEAEREKDESVHHDRIKATKGMNLTHIGHEERPKSMNTGWYNKSHAWPSLFCFSQMMPGGPEEALVRDQFKAHKGIFQCNEFAVLCKAKLWLGKGADGVKVHTWVNPTPPEPMGGSPGTETKSFLNTQTFINAWKILMKSDALWAHDWTVKADPDAVFFPDRLKDHLWKQTKENKMYYVLNCNYQGSPTLFGALEVFSKKALYNFEANWQKTCDVLPWRGRWGEDMFMHMCMIKIGVSPLVDYTLVGDNRCMQAPCTDKWRAAFHDFKSPGAWWGCYCQSEHCDQQQR